jgi:hypothetical protein
MTHARLENAHRETPPVPGLLPVPGRHGVKTTKSTERVLPVPRGIAVRQPEDRVYV